jgi:hypothetical protein
VTEFTLDDVREMIAAAMRSRGRLRQPGPEQMEQLKLLTNWLMEGVEASREIRAETAIGEDVGFALGILRAYHKHLADRWAIDVTEIEADFGEYLDALYRRVPTSTDDDDDCGPGEIPLLAESLALACQMAFAPANRMRAPSLKSDSVATRYAGIVIGELTGKELTGDAVKLHHLRIEKWREVQRSKSVGPVQKT